MGVSSVQITPGTGQPIAYDSNAALAAGAAVQIFSPANSDGTRQPFDPDGTPQTSPEPTTLLLDDFGAQAITVFHTVASGNSGVTPAASAGNVALSAGTASGGYAIMRSTQPLWLRGGTYLKLAHIVAYEATATVNSTRWWGYGTNQTTPTATAPVLNGVVWQLDSAAGDFQAAFYSNGTKTVVATLTRQNTNQHRYEIWYRQSVVYWVVDGLVVATRTFPNLAIATGMYAIAGAANAAAITAPTFNLSSVSAVDQGGNNRTISDGFNPAIQATVKAPSTAVAATDSPLAVGIHPSSPLPAGSAIIGYVGVQDGGTSASVKAASTAVAATDRSLVVGLHPSSPLPAGTNVLGDVRLRDASGNALESTAASTAATASQRGLVTSLHPSSPLPAGTNAIGTVALGAGANLAGAVSIGSISKIASYTTSTTTNAATVMRAVAGDLQAMLIANNAASTQYVKLYNAATVSLGTTAAIMDIPIAAGATITLNLGPNGLRFTTGIAYAVTGAAGLTNNTAGAGGVSVAASCI